MRGLRSQMVEKLKIMVEIQNRPSGKASTYAKGVREIELFLFYY